MRNEERLNKAADDFSERANFESDQYNALEGSFRSDLLAMTGIILPLLIKIQTESVRSCCELACFTLAILCLITSAISGGADYFIRLSFHKKRSERYYRLSDEAKERSLPADEDVTMQINTQFNALNSSIEAPSWLTKTQLATFCHRYLARIYATDEVLPLLTRTEFSPEVGTG